MTFFHLLKKFQQHLRNNKIDLAFELIWFCRDNFVHFFHEGMSSSQILSFRWWMAILMNKNNIWMKVNH